MIESINADNDYKNDNDDMMTVTMTTTATMIIMVVVVVVGTLFTLVMLSANTHPDEPYMSI